MTANLNSIEACRKAIDDTDARLIELLKHRANIARRVGDLKRSQGLSAHAPDRERNIMEKLSAQGCETLPGEAIASIFREIMSACLKLEEPIRVACLGPGTTFSCAAAQRAFGIGPQIVSEPTFDLVFDAIEKKRAHYGVVPIENSTEGTVNATLQRMVNSNLCIAAQLFLKVEQNLASHCNRLEDIRKIYSHPQALGQCRTWISQHTPQALLVETNSTAQACSFAKNEASSAAICAVSSALEHDLPLQRKNIHDSKGNETRFLIVAEDRMFSERDNDTTTLVFGVSNSFGQLAKVLNIFSEHGINLSKIQNLPDSQKPWNALFWVDLPLAQNNASFQKALVELRNSTIILSILGSYPTLVKTKY